MENLGPCRVISIEHFGGPYYKVFIGGTRIGTVKLDIDDWDTLLVRACIRRNSVNEWGPSNYRKVVKNASEVATLFPEIRQWFLKLILDGKISNG
jgi:hypothetical protein